MIKQIQLTSDCGPPLQANNQINNNLIIEIIPGKDTDSIKPNRYTIP